MNTYQLGLSRSSWTKASWHRSSCSNNGKFWVTKEAKSRSHDPLAKIRSPQTMFPRSSWIKRPQGCGVGGRFQREGTYVYLWLIHVVVWQKPTQHYKPTIFQLKKKKHKKKKKKISRGPISNLNAHWKEKKIFCKQIRQLNAMSFHKLTWELKGLAISVWEELCHILSEQFISKWRMPPSDT